jgi:tetratricopeptide (TPR) repeat protein
LVKKHLIRGFSPLVYVSLEDSVMRFKYSIAAVTAAVLLLISSAIASAQVGPLRGQVQVKQADGKLAPVPGAQIDVYRKDLPGKFETKADKKGNFVFAGLPFTGHYLIAISGAGVAPYVEPEVRPGGERDLSIIVGPGDGSRLTEADAKKFASSSAAAPAGASESAEDKAKREEAIKKNAQITAQNEKNKNINEIIGRTFKAGNDAYMAKKYDEAVAAYDEGLAADAEQPALWTNKARALESRAVEKFNKGDKEPAKADMKAAADAAGKAVELIKAQTAPTDPAELNRFNLNKVVAMSVYADAMRLFVSNVDKTKAADGVKAYEEYIALETDPKKKEMAEVQAAKIMFDANEYDNAIAAYKKILDRNPDDPDALVYSGMTLFNQAYLNNDKAKFQEAANFLQRFIEKAPDTHPLKADAKGVLDNIKASQNIKPEAAPTRRRRG